MNPKLHHVMGLDLGPPGDSTGLAIVEFSTGGYPRPKPNYQVRHLQRFAVGTPYQALIDAALEYSAPLNRPTLVVDQTAVGSPVVQQLHQARNCTGVMAITLTAGGAVHFGDDGSLHVPKKDLITRLQLVFQARRLKIAPTLADADLLSRELASFRMRPVVLDDASVQWRDGRNDDLVYAVGLAVWQAERSTPTSGFAPYVLGGGDCFSVQRGGWQP